MQASALVRGRRTFPRHCEPPGRRKAPPDDRLREAIHGTARQAWIASSLSLLAMTNSSAACPTGKSLVSLSSPSAKNIPLSTSGKSLALTRAVSCHRGALRNVINAERDAVDANALLTNSAEADGEVVWS